MFDAPLLLFLIFVKLLAFSAICVLIVMILYQRRLIYIPKIEGFPGAPPNADQVPQPSEYNFRPSIDQRTQDATCFSKLKVVNDAEKAKGKPKGKENLLTEYAVRKFTTLDGIELTSFWLPFGSYSTLRSAARTLDSSDTFLPVILYFHANAGNLVSRSFTDLHCFFLIIFYAKGHRLPIVEKMMQNFECHVYLASYRGYAGADGSPSESGLKLDAQAALEDLQSILADIRDSPDVSSSVSTHDNDAKALNAQPKILVYGQSLGSAVALSLYSRYQNVISGCIIENPFLSIPEMLPVFLPFLPRFLRHLRWIFFDSWDNMHEVRKIFLVDASKGHTTASRPRLMILTAKNDEVIPYSHSRLLFMNAAGQNFDGRLDSKDSSCTKESVLNGQLVMASFEEFGHNDVWLNENYFSTMKQFIDSCTLKRS